MDEKYPHIVYVERESTGSLNNRAASDVEDQIYDVEGLSNFLNIIFLGFA